MAAFRLTSIAFAWALAGCATAGRPAEGRTVLLARKTWAEGATCAAGCAGGVRAGEAVADCYAVNVGGALAASGRLHEGAPLVACVYR